MRDKKTHVYRVAGMIASIRGKKPHVYRVIILKQMADHTPEEFVRRFLKASRLSNRRFNNWWVIRAENVYTVRFPFEMRLYVKDSFHIFI